MVTAITQRWLNVSAAVTSIRTAAETSLATQFAAIKPYGAEALRNDAFARISAAGLPTRRIEAWHYTDLRSMMKVAASPAPRPSDELADNRPWSLIKGDNVFSFID